MDCKIGVRTYLEEELLKAKEKQKLRKVSGIFKIYSQNVLLRNESMSTRDIPTKHVTV